MIWLTNSFVGWHLAIRLDAVLEAVKLPARIASLDTSLTDMDGDTLTHTYLKMK
jgi:hypothetical protein